MKLQIIGTASICQKNNNASYLIDDHILIDMPSGNCTNLNKLNIKVEEIDNILITHFHGDHFLDMPIYFIEKDKEDELLVNIYCTKPGKKKIETLTKLAFTNFAKTSLSRIERNYNYNANFTIGSYEVSRIKVDHGEFKPAYGYVFKSDNLTVGFTGDTAYCDNVDYMASICDYLICDCTFIYGNESHMGIDDIKKLAYKYPDHKFVTSHMATETAKEAKKLKIKNIIVPSDGDIIISNDKKPTDRKSGEKIKE